MKYADCPTTEVEVVIAGSVDAVWELVSDLDQPSAIWRFSVAGSDGDVTLHQWFQMGPGRSGLNHAIDAMPDKEERIVARRLEEHRTSMQANLDGVKALIEGAAT